MLEVQENIPLAMRTTFQIGGNAGHFVEIHSDDDLRDALAWARERDINFFILAGGSNLLIPDKGLPLLVIHIATEAFGISDTTLTAYAGCNLLQLIRAAADQGLGGWEKLGGIPGTIGGAVRGNAGAFGSEIKDVVRFVQAINADTGEMHEFANAECEFSYRMSYFKKHPELIITRVYIDLERTDAAQSLYLIEGTIKERERRHIQNVRAAGSYFVNPVASHEVRDQFEREKKAHSREGRVPAGWLIEKAGMKGARVGGAIASIQHPNYLVNDMNATARDVKLLAEKIKTAVRTQFGIELHEEAVVL